MITLVIAFALAAPNPGAIDAPRHAFAACLKSFETSQLGAKVDPAAYEAAVKTACATEADGLSQALIKYDVAMGTKRATAISNAERDVDDYRLTSVERYRDIMANP
jgi:hypothetical protein